MVILYSGADRKRRPATVGLSVVYHKQDEWMQMKFGPERETATRSMKVPGGTL